MDSSSGDSSGSIDDPQEDSRFSSNTSRPNSSLGDSVPRSPRNGLLSLLAMAEDECHHPPNHSASGSDDNRKSFRLRRPPPRRVSGSPTRNDRGTTAGEEISADDRRDLKSSMSVPQSSASTPATAKRRRPGRVAPSAATATTTTTAVEHQRLLRPVDTPTKNETSKAAPSGASCPSGSSSTLNEASNRKGNVIDDTASQVSGHELQARRQRALGLLLARHDAASATSRSSAPRPGGRRRLVGQEESSATCDASSGERPLPPPPTDIELLLRCFEADTVCAEVVPDPNLTTGRCVLPVVAASRSPPLRSSSMPPDDSASSSGSVQAGRKRRRLEGNAATDESQPAAAAAAARPWMQYGCTACEYIFPPGPTNAAPDHALLCLVHHHAATAAHRARLRELFPSGIRFGMDKEPILAAGRSHALVFLNGVCVLVPRQPGGGTHFLPPSATPEGGGAGADEIAEADQTEMEARGLCDALWSPLGQLDDARSVATVSVEVTQPQCITQLVTRNAVYAARNAVRGAHHHRGVKQLLTDAPKRRITTVTDALLGRKRICHAGEASALRLAAQGYTWEELQLSEARINNRAMLLAWRPSTRSHGETSSLSYSLVLRSVAWRAGSGFASNSGDVPLDGEGGAPAQHRASAATLRNARRHTAEVDTLMSSASAPPNPLLLPPHLHVTEGQLLRASYAVRLDGALIAPSEPQVTTTSSFACNTSLVEDGQIGMEVASHVVSNWLENVSPS